MDSTPHVILTVHELSPWVVVGCGVAFGAAFKIGIEAVDCFAAGIAGVISGWLKARRKNGGANDVYPPDGRAA